MPLHPHHDRTVRLLEARLEAIARVSDHSLSGLLVDRQVLAAVTATRHAVELELITRGEADEIWARVAQRHPDAHWCRVPRLAA